MNLTRQVMITLSEEPMSLEDLAEKTGVETKQVYRVLSSLHKNRRIVHLWDVDGLRRYSPIEEA